MNFINIAGHLGADAETRFTPSGKKVISLRVASRTRRSRNNNDDTIWYRVSLWGDQYDKLVPYLKKGSAIIVFGELHKPELWTDKEGKQQITLEITAAHIEFSPFGKPGGSPQEAGGQPYQPQQNMANPYVSSPIGTMQGKGETFDDEVPF